MERLYLKKIEENVRFKHKVVVFGQNDENRKLILNKIGDLLSNKNYIIAVGTQIYSYTLYEEKKPLVRLYLWEISNEERFQFLDDVYFKGTTTVILFYFGDEHFNLEFYRRKIENLKDKLGDKTLFYFISVFPRDDPIYNTKDIDIYNSEILTYEKEITEWLGSKSQFFIIHSFKDINMALYSLGKELLQKGEDFLTKDLGFGFSPTFMKHLKGLNLGLINDKWIEIPDKKGFFRIDVFSAQLYYCPDLNNYENNCVVDFSQSSILKKEDVDKLRIEEHEKRILHIIHSILEGKLSLASD